MDKTNVFIVSAPSGSGKSTLVDRLLKTVPNLVFSISYTTRSPRGKETHGEHYFFVSHEEFQGMVDRDEFLEHAVLFEKDMYGTARRFLDEARERSCDLVLDIDVQGAEQMKQRIPYATSIFILPPSRGVLEQRLRGRGEDSDEVIERRLRRAVREIENYSKYDYVIINDDKERAGEKLCAIVLRARWKKQHDGVPADPQVQRWFQLAQGCLTRDAAPDVEPIRQTFLEARPSESH